MRTLLLILVILLVSGSLILVKGCCERKQQELVVVTEGSVVHQGAYVTDFSLWPLERDGNIEHYLYGRLKDKTPYKASLNEIQAYAAPSLDYSTSLWLIYHPQTKVKLLTEEAEFLLFDQNNEKVETHNVEIFPDKKVSVLFNKKINYVTLKLQGTKEETNHIASIKIKIPIVLDEHPYTIKLWMERRTEHYLDCSDWRFPGSP